MSWTEERVTLLKKLWGEGCTAAEIAKELGGVTRNAVIGKAHRLKLSNRVSPIQQNKKQAVKTVPETPTSMVKKKEKIVPLVEIPVKGVSMAELKEKMCRWPNGDPQEKSFSFCGISSVPGLPYCEGHAKVAYQSSSRARILQPEDFEDKRADVSEEDDLKEAVGAS